jgi:hypothetical protein
MAWMRKTHAQGRLALDDLAHLIDLLDLGDGEGAHRGTDVARAHHDAHFFELGESCAHKVPRMAETLEQRLLAQALTRLQAAEDDLLLQRVRDHLVRCLGHVRFSRFGFQARRPSP